MVFSVNVALTAVAFPQASSILVMTQCTDRVTIDYQIEKNKKMV